MLGRATNNRARIRVLMVAACLLAGPGVTGSGQVRFTGPSETVSQADLQPVRENPFRRSQGVQQVQYRDHPAADSLRGPRGGRHRERVGAICRPQPDRRRSRDPCSRCGHLRSAVAGDPEGEPLYAGEFMAAPLEEAYVEAAGRSSTARTIGSAEVIGTASKTLWCCCGPT